MSLFMYGYIREEEREIISQLLMRMGMGSLRRVLLLTIVTAVLQVQSTPFFNLFGGNNNDNDDSDTGCRPGYEYVTETTYETSYEQQCSTSYENECSTEYETECSTGERVVQVRRREDRI